MFIQQSETIGQQGKPYFKASWIFYFNFRIGFENNVYQCIVSISLLLITKINYHI